MDKLKRKSTKVESKFQDTAVVNKKNLVLGSIVATLIAATPFLFNLYQSIPDEKVWDTFLFTYESNYYGSVYVLGWTLATKLVPLFLFFLWFFTCKHWWYHSILVPIVLHVYQIIIIFNDDIGQADSNLVLVLLPLMAVIIPSIYLVRARMFNKLTEKDKTMEELEEEFKIKPKSFFGRLSDYF